MTNPLSGVILMETFQKKEVFLIATMKDVARRAGLGLGTVSRFYNGISVKEANREKIEAAAKALNYIQNPIAKSMKTGKSMTVAVVVPNLSNMFSMRIIESIEEALEPHGYSIVVSGCRSKADRELERLRMFRHKRVDGFILMPVSQYAAPILEAAEQTPLVLIDRLVDSPSFDAVIVNNRQAVYREVSDALTSGITRIGIIEGPSSVYTARERRAGYEDALREAELTSCCVQSGGYTVESGYHAMRKMLEDRPQAVFISNYELTVGAMNAMYESNARIRLIGFDHVEFSAIERTGNRFISQPVEKIGMTAAALLLKRMHGNAGTPECKILEL